MTRGYLPGAFGPERKADAVFEAEAESQLRAALQVVLDCVDYTSGACALTESVGAVLPSDVIEMARRVLKSTEVQA